MKDNYNNFQLTNEKGEIIRNNRGDIGINGMVSTAKFEASKIGIDIIKSGGNAIDAAVAVGFAIGVCEPNASGIGGGGFMTIRLGEDKENIFLDFREIAPNGSVPSMWKMDDQGGVIGNEKSEGGKSICVPGEVAGLIFALENYGTMNLEEVLAPAIHLAEQGFVVTDTLKRDIDEYKDKLLRFEEDGNVFLRDYEVGEKIINRPLANTLRKIAKEGKNGFYKGAIADCIVESVRKHSGIMTREDLENYRVNQLKPIRGSYRGYEIISSPLPSSGGTHIIQILNILENFDISSYEVNSAEYLHILSEIFKMCFADRMKYMGDPNFCHVPIKGLIAKGYGKKLAGKIDIKKANKYKFDNPFDFESTDTTHYSIADKDGNMVSVTKTISAFFGSGVVPKNTGIVCNCQMRGFSIGEGKANSVGPKKKPLSSMSPTIILKDKKPFAVLGSPGGNRIITTVSQVISKLIDHNMNIEEAINSPRISNDINGIMLYESRIAKGTIEELENKGHIVNKLQKYDRKLGGVQGIKYTDEHLIEGAADPRRDGVAIGY
ncbi:MAG: gamma-glutamyltransferase [Marinisporobacter sp.]|jgi:gamma-glutamyltranspeptidase/glutathione hydrolase|nr:gamma-glutamyltransferase [Marinisporobacter sp.]